MAVRESHETVDEFHGMEFGRYEVIRRLAVGGMAEIFLARDTGVQGVTRLVVLKCILPAIGQDPAFVDLFLDEIRIVARLSHPNIAHLYDFGETDGRYFIAMEYIDGGHVSQIVRGIHPKLIPIEHAIRIISLVAEALYYAHNLEDEHGQPLGIIHRDVSPENVMISRDGQVKLVDFGVARAADQVHQTQVGVLRGKAAYLSPEQCMAKPLDHRVDIFSIGTVLHEMLSGRRLFKRDTDFRTMRAVCSEPIPLPSEVRPGVPVKLDSIILKALSRNPADRYQHADELNFALEQVLQEERLLSNQILLGRFVRAALKDEDAKKGVGTPAFVGKKDKKASPTVPVVRQSSAGIKRSPVKPSSLEISLAIDIDDAMSELTGKDEVSDASWVKGPQPSQGGPRRRSRRKTKSIDLAIEKGLLLEDIEPSFEDDSLEGTIEEIIGFRSIGAELEAPTRRDPSSKKRTSRSDPSSQKRSPAIGRAPGGGESDRAARPGKSAPTVRVVPERKRSEPSPPKAVKHIQLSGAERFNSRGESPPSSQSNTGKESRALIVDSAVLDERSQKGLPVLTFNDPRLDLTDLEEEGPTNVWIAEGASPHRAANESSGRGRKQRTSSSGPWPTEVEKTERDQTSIYRGKSSLRRLVARVLFLSFAILAALITVSLKSVREEPEVQRVPTDSPSQRNVAPAPPPATIEPTSRPDSDLQADTSEAPDVETTGSIGLNVDENDTVIIDDVIVAQSSAYKGVRLSEGEHKIRVIRPRHQQWRKRVEVVVGTHFQLNPRLKLAGPRWGFLTVTSAVESDVYISDTLFGRTPVHEVVLWPGWHMVTLVTGDKRRITEKIAVRRGLESKIEVDELGAVSILSDENEE